MRRLFLLAVTSALIVQAGAATARADYGSDVRATPGLAAYWPLDERAGAPVEALTGTPAISSGTPSPGAPTARSDDGGAALRLDGRSAASVSGIAGHTGAFSLEAWLRPEAAASTRYIVSRGTTSTSGYHLGPDAGRLFLTVGTAAGNATMLGPAVPSGSWHHVAATVAAGQAILYLDGVEAARSAVTARAVNATATLVLGRYARRASGFWSGALDEVALYSSALTAEAVKAHYVTGSAGPAPLTRLIGTPAALGSRGDATFDVAGSKSGLAFECRLDGGAPVSCADSVRYTGLGDGDHTFSVRATDRYGAVEPAPASFVWRIDRAAPDTLLLAAKPPAPGVPATASFASEPGASFECRTGGGAWSPCASPATVPPSADGTPFAVRAIDGAGNVDASPATTTLSPDVDVTRPASFAYARAAFDIAGARSSSSVECRLDDAAWTPCPAPLTFEKLAPGTHSIAIRDVRLAAVAATPSLTWAVTLPAPRLIGANFPALVSLGTKKAQRKTSAKRLPRLLYQSNVTALTTFELRRGKKLVRRWTGQTVPGSNAAVLPRAAWLKLGGGRYWLSATASNPSGRSSLVRRRFDAVRRARR